MQEIKYISIDDLVLWSENPRDTITSNANNDQIIKHALADGRKKWGLKKFALSMGEHFDLSEIPTVVYHGKTPIVYDGNRRVAVAKIINSATLKSENQFPDIEIPENLPCNVCDIDTAIANVLRKHKDSGTWTPLDRDIFISKYTKQGKSIFLILNEATGIIDKSPALNKVFVKEEILTKDNLAKVGIFISNDELRTTHNENEFDSILDHIKSLIETEEISTRKNRWKLLEVFSHKNKDIIQKNSANEPRLVHQVRKIEDDSYAAKPAQRQTKVTKKVKTTIFGMPLYLKHGDVNDLYRDIVSISDFHEKNKSNLSPSFTAIIRMSLRLLCETAAKESGKALNVYIDDNFQTAKKDLDIDAKTTLAAQNVTQSSIIQLLQSGAHNYTSCKNHEQNMAISLIIGKIINITHGKQQP